MKKLLALVISVVAVAAFAAPASAAPRVFSVTATCVPVGGGLYLFGSTDVAGTAQQDAIVGLRQFLKFDEERCEPGTLEITVEPQ
jgi:hypothetical protein